MSDEAVSISISMPPYCLGKTPFCLFLMLGKIQFFPPALLLYLYILTQSTSLCQWSHM